MGSVVGSGASAPVTRRPVSNALAARVMHLVNRLRRDIPTVVLR